MTLFYILLPYDDFATKVLNAVLMTIAAGIAHAQFERFAKQPAVATFPTNPKFWTTFWNFAPMRFAYVLLALGAFVLLQWLPGLPEKLISLCTSCFEGQWKEPVSSFKESFQNTKQAIPPYTKPFLTFAALVILAHPRSPLAVLEKSLRSVLHRWSSIPERIRMTVDQLQSASFDQKSERRSAVEDWLKEETSDALRKAFFSKLGGAGYKDRLYRAVSQMIELKSWSDTNSRLFELRKSCSTLLDGHESHLSSIVTEIELLASFDTGGRDHIEHDAEDSKREILERLDKLEAQQDAPFACGVMRYSRWAEVRRRYIHSLGIVVTKPPSPYFVFSSLRGDLATLILVSWLGYYLGCVLAHLLGWTTEKPATEIYGVFPLQVVVFSLAAVLPCLLIYERIPREDHAYTWSFLGDQRKIHTVAYLAIAIAAFLSGGVMLTCVRWAVESLSAGSFSEGWTNAEKSIGKYGAFSLIAATIGAITAVLFDVGAVFKGRSLVDGLLTGLAAVASAFLATQLIPHPGSPATAVVDPSHLRMVLPVVFLMGLAVGLLMPAGYRRYRTLNIGNSRRPHRHPLKPRRSDAEGVILR